MEISGFRIQPIEATSGYGHNATPAPPQSVAQAVRLLNRTRFAGERSELTIVVDEQTRRPTIRILDRETKEVLQQIPPEYVLRLAEEVRSRR